MLKKEFRLQKDFQFQKVKKQGQATRSAHFLLNYLKNETKSSRFGFIVTKKQGRAFLRHRIQRVLREVVRLELDQIKKGYDIVIVVISPSVVDLSFSAVQKELELLLGTVGLLQGNK